MPEKVKTECLALEPSGRPRLAPRARSITGPSTDPTPHHTPRLDEMLRELVRSEVRAEVARALASAPAQPTHVSVAEYAAARSISASTVRNAIRNGRLPAMKIGAAIRVLATAEIGRPVIANANGRDASPAARAEQILARRNTGQ